MPRGRRNLTYLTLVAVGVAVVVAGCGSADHTWQGEFDARLEGAAAAVEAAHCESS